MAHIKGCRCIFCLKELQALRPRRQQGRAETHIATGQPTPYKDPYWAEPAQEHWDQQPYHPGDGQG